MLQQLGDDCVGELVDLLPGEPIHQLRAPPCSYGADYSLANASYRHGCAFPALTCCKVTKIGGRRR
jgi:hypothetical protein